MTEKRCLLTSSGGWPAHPGWEHTDGLYLKMKTVVEAFRGFASGNGKWHKGVAWSGHKTHPPNIFIPLYIITFICLVVGFGHYLTGHDAPEEGGAVKFLGVVFFCFSILCWAGRYKPIRPWGWSQYRGTLRGSFIPDTRSCGGCRRASGSPRPHRSGGQGRTRDSS